MRTLTRLNIADAVRAVGLQDAPGPVRAVVGAPFRRPALRLARRLAAFDDGVATEGLPAAAGLLLGQLVPALEVRGAVPTTGPLLVVANHPGLFDALALLAAIGREDASIVALAHPFTRALPHLAGHLIEVPAHGPRGHVVREVAARLRRGEAVLTFPAGTIEPDPAVRADPGSLAAWSGSTARIVSLVPGTVVAGALVSGVHTRRGLEHPLTRLRRREADREWLAAILQLLWTPLRTRGVRVAFTPVSPDADAVMRSLADLLAPRAAEVPRTRG